MEAKNDNCRICEIEDKEGIKDIKYILCDSDKYWYCIKCLYISEKEFELLIKTRKKYQCLYCKIPNEMVEDIKMYKRKEREEVKEKEKEEKNERKMIKIIGKIGLGRNIKYKVEMKDELEPRIMSLEEIKEEDEEIYRRYYLKRRAEAQERLREKKKQRVVLENPENEE